MLSLSENSGQGVSKWRFCDIALCAVILAGVCFFGSYVLYFKAVVITFFILAAVIASKKLYLKGVPRSVRFRRITASVRIIAYIAGITVLAMPWCLVRSDKPQLYSLQKLFYGTNKQAEEFLPKSIPENTEDYRSVFLRSVFPGATKIELSFVTDSSVIAEYRQKAVGRGATSSPASSLILTKQCKAEAEKAGASFDDAEVWYYPNGSEHFPKYYILDEKTGFVYIYF